MNISSRFSIAIHILTLLEHNKEGHNTSEWIAKSVNTNPVVIRRIIQLLKQANLVDVRPGVGGAYLTCDLEEVTLLDVYKAVHVVDEGDLFRIHADPNPACPIGANIQAAVEHVFLRAQQAMEGVLENVTVMEILQTIQSRQ
jgi:DNA-binding IscR family transcriptional regulator